MFTVPGKLPAPVARSTPPKWRGSPSAYEQHKLRMAEKSREKHRDLREIADDIPPVKNPKRRARCLASLPLFCKTYLPDAFNLPFSKDHLRALDLIDDAIAHGRQLAIGSPRGDGKTARCVAAMLRAILSGKHRYAMLVCATKKDATELLEGIKTRLEKSQELLADFPEVVYPIRCLDGINQRRLLWNGQRIIQSATKDRIILPSLPPNPAASAIIAVAGITGRIRGRKYTRPDGREERPSIVLVDDPQTKRSSKSPTQCDERENTINADIMGLAGPDVPIAVIVAATIIHPNDVADRLLNQELNRQWNGITTKMVNSWPTDPAASEHWEQYMALQRRSPKQATAYYRQHRKVMDAGGEVSWPARKYPGTLSPLQHAYNLRAKMGDVAFDCEYQNSPPRPELSEEAQITADQVAAKLSGYPRFVIPNSATVLTAYIDVQESILPYAVGAYAPGFTGDIVDYGCYPDQGQIAWKKSAVQRDYRKENANDAFEAQLWAALDKLCAQLLDRKWLKEDGTELTIGRCLIDSGHWADIVFGFCRQSRFRNIVMPSKGRGIGAAALPMSEYQQRPGETPGLNWRINTPPGRPCRHLLYDTNFWKSFFEDRLKTKWGPAVASRCTGTRPPRTG